jgi:TP901 family phage tail tape measure protein
MAGLHAVVGGFGLLKQGVSEAAFGLANLGTSGNIGMGALSTGVANVGRGFLLLGGVVAAIGAATAIYLGVQAVRAAGDFQQGLNRLVTGAGDVTDNMGKMGTAILGISTSTGVLTGQLLPAMYQIISANQRGTQAEDTLRVAAMGSVAEQAKIVDVAKAITTAMTDYGTKQYNATQFMNGYTRATQLGKVTLEQLSNSMGPILPLAKNIGISFADVAGAMATMTNAGIPANVAATSLRFLMQSLENPTLKARNAMDAMGLSSVAVGNEMKVSLPGALDMIYKAALKAGPEGSVPFNRAMSDMVGGQRSLQAMLSLTGSHFGTFSADSRAVAAAMNLSKTAVLGWDVAQGNFNVKMDMARAAVAALGIIIGSQLLPFLSQLVGMVLPLISSFTQWVVQSHVVENAMHTLVSALQRLVAIGASVVAFFKNNEMAMSALKGVLITLAAVIAIALVSALIAAAGAAWTFAAGMVTGLAPIYLVIAGVALLVAAFIHFYNTSATFRGIVDQIVGALKQLWAAILQVAAFLIANFVPALQRAWAAIQQGAAFLAQLGATIMGAVMPFLTTLWNFIVANFIPVWRQLQASWAALLPVIAQLGGVIGLLGAAFAPLVPVLRQVWSVIQPLLIPALIALGVVIGGILAIALGLLIGVLTGVIAALATFLRGVIMVIQGIAQALTGFIQVISGIVAIIVDICTGNFDHLAADLGMIWQGIVNMFQGVWTIIVGIFTATIGTIISLVAGFIQGIIGFFTNLYNALVGGSIVPDMCNGIVNAFTGMVSSVLALVSGFISSAIALFISLGAQAVTAVTNAANQVITAFNNMKDQAISTVQGLVSGVGATLNQLAGIAASAGRAMIDALVGQINAGVGWVAGAVNNVVSTIRNLLPGSPAKEGPLRDLPKFGPAITSGLASGIRSGIPEVRAAADQMVAPIGASMSSTTTHGAGGTSASDNRPIIIQVGNAQYQAFIRNLGRDMATQIYIQGGGKL